MRFVDDHDDYGVIRTCVESMLEDGKSADDIREAVEEILDDAEAEDED